MSEPVHAASASSLSTNGTRRGGVTYWFVACALVLFVALLTGQRQNNWGADAWEHHRAIVALARNMADPGNPTLAVSEPSIRYSPYSVGLAFVVKMTGLDAYDVLSAAAVLSTGLLLSALWALLKSFGEVEAGSSVLIVMLTLYGQVPAYAGSLALSDLPWHQVNPSAAAMALLLLSLWTLKGIAERRLHWPWACLVIASTAFTLLSHGMSALIYIVGFAVLSMTLPGRARVRSACFAAACCAIAVALAFAWPWYDFWFAASAKPDNEYWFNPTILRTMLFSWCLPSALAALPALTLADRPLVRLGLLTGLACTSCSLVAFVLKSPALARLALPGLIFFQVAIGVYVHEIGLLRPSTWFPRLRRIVSTDLESASSASMQTLLAFGILYFGLPQVWTTLREPYLARKWIAPLVGAEDKQLEPRERLARLMRDVGVDDVVLADLLTSWPVPSVRGKVVAALHREFFVRDQARREADVAAFFSLDPNVDRRAIIERYRARWILLCEQNLGPEVAAALRAQEAVVGDDGLFSLIDVRRWVTAHATEN